MRRAPFFRSSTSQLLLLVAVTAVGLALSPSGAEYLAAFCPAALLLRHVAPSLALLLGGLGLGFLSFVELLLAMPVTACLYLSVALALAPRWPLTPARQDGGASGDRGSRGQIRRGIAFLIVSAWIAALYLIPWTSRKPFLRALFSIRRGMTSDEVNRRMAGYQEGTGWVDPITNQEIQIKGSRVFRHSDDPRWNADWGVVSFQEGRVVDVRFDPD